jgi:hypothetical protein
VRAKLHAAGTTFLLTFFLCAAVVAPDPPIVSYHSWADRFTWYRVRVSGGELPAAFVLDLGPVEPYVTAKPVTS